MSPALLRLGIGTLIAIPVAAGAAAIAAEAPAWVAVSVVGLDAGVIAATLLLAAVIRDVRRRRQLVIQSYLSQARKRLAAGVRRKRS